MEWIIVDRDVLFKSEHRKLLILDIFSRVLIYARPIIPLCRNENHVRSSLESERRRSSSSIVYPTRRTTAIFSVEFIKWMVTIYATMIITMSRGKVWWNFRKSYVEIFFLVVDATLFQTLSEISFVNERFFSFWSLNTIVVIDSAISEKSG